MAAESEEAALLTDSVHAEGSSTAADTLTLKILTGEKKLDVKLQQDSTVSALKQSISEQGGEAFAGKFMRLISAGKQLTPDTAALSTFKLANMSFVHCVLSAKPPQQFQPSTTEAAVPEEPEDDDPAQRRGFDTLRNSGMSRADVAALRSYFAAQVRQSAEQAAASSDADAAAAEHPEAGLSDWDRQMINEERFMRAQTPDSEFALNTAQRMSTSAASFQIDQSDAQPEPGSRVDFMLGFLFGSLLGFIMLFWVYDSSISQKRRYGIVCGVIFQLLFSMSHRATAA